MWKIVKKVTFLFNGFQGQREAIWEAVYFNWTARKSLDWDVNVNLFQKDCRKGTVFNKLEKARTLWKSSLRLGAKNIYSLISLKTKISKSTWSFRIWTRWWIRSYFFTMNYFTEPSVWLAALFSLGACFAVVITELEMSLNCSREKVKLSSCIMFKT